MQSLYISHIATITSNGRLLVVSPVIYEYILTESLAATAPWRLLHGIGYDGYFSIEVIHAVGSDADGGTIFDRFPDFAIVFGRGSNGPMGIL